jgi:hypothetical protein
MVRVIRVCDTCGAEHEMVLDERGGGALYGSPTLDLTLRELMVEFKCSDCILDALRSRASTRGAR